MVKNIKSLILSMVIFIFSFTVVFAKLPQSIKRTDYGSWATNKTKHVLPPLTYFCYTEKQTRLIANYIISYGTISKRKVHEWSCYFIKMASAVQIIKISLDGKIAKIYTHKSVYANFKTIEMYEVYTPVYNLQLAKKFFKQQF